MGDSRRTAGGGMSLLAAALSRDAQKVVDIMRGDKCPGRPARLCRGVGFRRQPNAALPVPRLPGAVEAAAVRGGRGAVPRSRGRVLLAFLGTPSATSPWMLQLATPPGDQLTLREARRDDTSCRRHSRRATPSKGRTVGSKENDKAFAPDQLLDAAQRRQAFSLTSPTLSRGQDGRMIQPKASASALTRRSRRADRHRPGMGHHHDGVCEPRMAEIRPNCATPISLEWVDDERQRRVFRIQGRRW